MNIQPLATAQGILKHQQYGYFVGIASWTPDITYNISLQILMWHWATGISDLKDAEASKRFCFSPVKETLMLRRQNMRLLCCVCCRA